MTACNAALNIKAIIARLDFIYMDKNIYLCFGAKAFHLKTGSEKYYPILRRSKLTAIVKKIIMWNEGDANLIQSLKSKIPRTDIAYLRFLANL